METGVAGWARGIALALTLVSVSACKTDWDWGSTNASATPSAEQPINPNPSAPLPTPSENAPPRISGSPPGVAVVDRTFSFVPSATDADGDELSFAISSKPSWASFSTATGRLSGTPRAVDIGSHEQIQISVNDGAQSETLPQFAVTVVRSRKANYGHYFATRYSDTPAEAAMLCEQVGVSGVVWRRTWNEVEPTAGVYNFDSLDDVLAAIAASSNPTCQVWLLVEFKSFEYSPVKNPCPKYLQAQHSAPNASGNGAATCFMWEPLVVKAYAAMMKAAAARYNNHARIEGFILQESSLGFNEAFSQDVGDGGTYTPEAWRDALIDLIGQCGTAFSQSRCMAFVNFLRGGQRYLHDISAAISAVPDNRACLSGPDLLPDDVTLYDNDNSAYEVLARHDGCRSNSAQNDSFEVSGCGLDCIFRFAVGGTFGDFDQSAPRASGVCVNSYLMWNHRFSQKGLDWTDALPVIAANPYGPEWHEQCPTGGGAP